MFIPTQTHRPAVPVVLTVAVLVILPAAADAERSALMLGDAATEARLAQIRSTGLDRSLLLVFLSGAAGAAERVCRCIRARVTAMIAWRRWPRAVDAICNLRLIAVPLGVFAAWRKRHRAMGFSVAHLLRLRYAPDPVVHD